MFYAKTKYWLSQSEIRAGSAGCPSCYGTLDVQDNVLFCGACNDTYKTSKIGNIPDSIQAVLAEKKNRESEVELLKSSIDDLAKQGHGDLAVGLQSVLSEYLPPTYEVVPVEYVDACRVLADVEVQLVRNNQLKHLGSRVAIFRHELNQMIKGVRQNG